MGEELVVEYNLLPQMAAALHDAVADVVARTAKEIAAESQNAAPVDTGFLQSSIYVVTQTESTYGQGIVPGKGSSYLLPEIDKATDDQTAYIAVGSNYGIFVEMGTSRMAAQPYFTPAVEMGRSFFTSWLSDMEKDLKKRAHAP